MNIKILKFELFTLFFLTFVTVMVFYFKEALPDNYLSISSTSTHGFFAYYSTSFFTFINYYSGLWVFFPCLFFTGFYVFLFSRRADGIDLFNIFFLSLFFLLSIFYMAPSLVGHGLYQILNSAFSPVGMFFAWSASGVFFLWGSFRGEFIVKMQKFFSFLKLIGDKKNIEEKDNTEEKDDLISKNKKAIIFTTVEENKSCENEIHDEEAPLKTIPITETKKIEVAKIDSEEQQNEIFNDDKYYNLVKLASHKKQDLKFSQPEDKYFHDIILKIQAKLGEFRINGQIINVLKGPVVDTFEWELGVGERVSRLTSIAEDLSLALSGSPIRMVYPMKGRTTVGIEVPRNPRDFIYLDEIIGSKDFTHTTHQLPLAMGKDAFGEPVVVDLAAMPHMLVAGSTGAGKSVFINSILVSLLIKKSPNQMKLILIDPKQLELALYARLPHLIMPVITEAKTATTALLWACQEMERRYSIMSEFGVRNIEGFNHKLKTATKSAMEQIAKFYEYSSIVEGYELPYIVIIVDEFADLILTQKGKEIETHICRLAAKARAAGIHLMLATQRPSVDVITGLIKSNFPTRVSFRVTSSTDSRTILNAMGAEKLLGKGDMLYKQGVDTTRIHSAYIEELEIESLTEKLSEMAPAFDPSVMEFLENGGEEEGAMNLLASGGSDGISGKDDKYEEAVRVVLEHRTASASLLQRRLGVGYNRAANLIEEMESKGVVGPAQGSKPRKVLMGSESLT